MATFTPLSEHDAAHLASAYALGDPHRVIPIPQGSVNSNFRLEVARDGVVTSYFVRVFEEQDRAGAEYDAALVQHLARRGVPSPCPLTRSDGAVLSTIAGKPASVFPFIAGVSTCQRAVDVARAHALGRALAGIHVAGAGFSIRRSGRFRIEDLYARMPRIAGASDPEIAAMAEELPHELDRWSRARTADVPQGVVHGDLFRDNVLFKCAEGEGHDEIVALLDFESASDGRFIYDLAVTVLAWCMGDSFEPELARAIVEGYETVRPLDPNERDAMRAELAIAALRFTTTRITDYALREGSGDRVIKDWKRFLRRLREVERIPPFWLRDTR